jgi:hypothetical protein
MVSQQLGVGVRVRAICEKAAPLSKLRPQATGFGFQGTQRRNIVAATSATHHLWVSQYGNRCRVGEHHRIAERRGMVGSIGGALRRPELEEVRGIVHHATRGGDGR